MCVFVGWKGMFAWFVWEARGGDPVWPAQLWRPRCGGDLGGALISLLLPPVPDGGDLLQPGAVTLTSLGGT